MIDEPRRTGVDRLVAGYQRGIYTALEVQSAVVAAMPVQSASELRSRLPEEIVQGLRARAREFSDSSEDDWVELVTINGPPFTEESGRLFIRKQLALNAYFMSHVDNS